MVLGIARYVVIHLGDVYVLFVGYRRCEVNSLVVKSISKARHIRRRQRIHILQRGLVGSQSLRIEFRELCLSESDKTSGGRISLAADSLCCKCTSARTV